MGRITKQAISVLLNSLSCPTFHFRLFVIQVNRFGAQATAQIYGRQTGPEHLQCPGGQARTPGASAGWLSQSQNDLPLFYCRDIREPTVCPIPHPLTLFCWAHVSSLQFPSQVTKVLTTLPSLKILENALFIEGMMINVYTGIVQEYYRLAHAIKATMC